MILAIHADCTAAGEEIGLSRIGAHGELRPAVVPGQPLSGSDEVIAGATEFALNNLGDIAFIGWTGGLRGVFLRTEDFLFPVGWSGQAIPGSAVVLGPVGFPSVNDRREVVVVNGHPAMRRFDYRSSALVRWSEGRLEEVAVVERPIPGTEGASFCGFFSSPRVAGSGSLFFQSNLRRSGNCIGFALFARDPEGRLNLVVQGGDVLEGLGEVKFIGPYHSNEQGAVVLLASLDGGAYSIVVLEQQ